MVPATAGPLDLVIGKPTHHACAMPAAAGKISDTVLSHDKIQSRRVFVDLQDHRTVLVAVDQPAPSVPCRFREPGGGDFLLGSRQFLYL